MAPQLLSARAVCTVYQLDVGMSHRKLSVQPLCCCRQRKREANAMPACAEALKFNMFSCFAETCRVDGAPLIKGVQTIYK